MAAYMALSLAVAARKRNLRPIACWTGRAAEARNSRGSATYRLRRSRRDGRLRKWISSAFGPHDARDKGRRGVAAPPFAPAATTYFAAVASALGMVLPIIASISDITRSGAAFCTIWPTPGNTISFAFGTVAASGCEWIWVDTVLSEPS